MVSLPQVQYLIRGLSLRAEKQILIVITHLSHARYLLLLLDEMIPRWRYS